jgi:hypothetical protein
MRMYQQAPWEVQVWVDEENPATLHEVYVRCLQCQSGFTHRAVPHWVLASLRTKPETRYLIKLSVCACTPIPFTLTLGTCPPWLTRAEEVAWRLQ